MALSTAPVASAAPSGCAVTLYERRPERLVLEGFRRWMAGYNSGNLGNWEDVWNLYTLELGWRQAGLVVERLAQFVHTVRDWSICPISCFPGGCRHICRHECFALAMVASSQNQDPDSLAAAMGHLIDPQGHAAAIQPALAYAQAMRDNDLLLMPVPRHVIDDIAGRPVHERLH